MWTKGKYKMAKKSVIQLIPERDEALVNEETITRENRQGENILVLTVANSWAQIPIIKVNCRETVSTRHNQTR